jgi:mono/diheme cytochrome c family protein
MNTHSTAPFILGSCVIVAVGLTFAAPQTTRAQTTAAQATTLQTAGDPIAGRATFTEYCSICHGATAQGFIGPRIAGINFGNTAVRAIVRHGLGGYGGMPAFSRESVSDRNIDNIVAYLVSLGPPPAAAAPARAVADAATDAPPAAGSSAVGSSGGSGGDAAHGGMLFAANCASCHGAAGQGGFGPSLKMRRAARTSPRP